MNFNDGTFDSGSNLRPSSGWNLFPVVTPFRWTWTISQPFDPEETALAELAFEESELENLP
jgi:hypothetical protein